MERALASAGQWCASHWLWVAGASVCTLAILESLYRRHDYRASASRMGLRWAANLLTYVASAVLVGWVTPQFVVLLSGAQHVRLLSWSVQQQLGPILVFVIGWLLLDLVIYVIHRLSHAVPLLWAWHRLHHDDADLDYTTGIRHHPLETLVTAFVLQLIFVPLGLPPWFFQVIAVIEFPLSCFHHINARLVPYPVERVLATVLVMPKDHQAHHSLDARHFDKNFGVYFSIWDRVFGTYYASSRDEVAGMKFGLAQTPAPHRWWRAIVSRVNTPHNPLLIAFSLITILIGLDGKTLGSVHAAAVARPREVTLVIQPIQVCTSDGGRCASVAQLPDYQAEVDRVYAAAGIGSTFLPTVQYRDSAALTIQIDDGDGSGTGTPTDEARRLMRLPGHSQHRDPSVINLFIVDAIATTSGYPIHGLGLENANGVIVGCEAGCSADIFAHELGHVLGLGHTDDPDNVMRHAGRNGRNDLTEAQRRRVRQPLFSADGSFAELRRSGACTSSACTWQVDARPAHAGETLRALRLRFLDGAPASASGANGCAVDSKRTDYPDGSELVIEFRAACFANGSTQLLELSPSSSPFSAQFDFSTGQSHSIALGFAE